MNTVQPIAFAERPIFYREQDCNMYSVLIYSITNSLVEVGFLHLDCLLSLTVFLCLRLSLSSNLRNRSPI
jgi:hypothetical protein